MDKGLQRALNEAAVDFGFSSIDEVLNKPERYVYRPYVDDIKKFLEEVSKIPKPKYSQIWGRKESLEQFIESNFLTSEKPISIGSNTFSVPLVERKGMPKDTIALVGEDGEVYRVIIMERERDWHIISGETLSSVWSFIQESE